MNGRFSKRKIGRTVVRDASVSNTRLILFLMGRYRKSGELLWSRAGKISGLILDFFP